MEEAILAAESRAQELESTLNDPQFYARRAADARGVAATLEVARAEVSRLYARWAELEAVESQESAGHG
jgi:ATP-binding cassette subfamily F protein uup